MHREHRQDMIWLETSPEATRLQVVFRSNQKKKNKQTNKQKNHRCQSQYNMLSVCKLAVLYCMGAMQDHISM